MTRTSTWEWRRIAGTAALVVVTAQAGRAHMEALSGAFRAEVTVERAVVDERGKVVRDMPGSRYRMERTADGRVRLTLLPTRPYPVAGPLADAYAGIVVEQDPATGTLRVLGKDGKPLPGAPPMPSSLAQSAVPAVSDDGLITRRPLAARRAALAGSLGPRVGTMRGLERYVVKRGSAIEEVLVSPDTALPVEINVVDGGALTERHQFTYETRSDGFVVRTRSRSESRLGAGRERLVSVTTLTQVEIGGAQ